MKVLIVLTSHAHLGDTGRRTGLWLEELAAPYYVFSDTGWEVTLASPTGGAVPVDPKSNLPEAHTDDTQRFSADVEAQRLVATTLRLDFVEAARFDAVFYPGGHGPLWDLVDEPSSLRIIERALTARQPLALVCHAPAALLNARRADGTWWLAGKRVTGFSNSEEDAVHLTEVVPFLLEDELVGRGAQYSKERDFAPHVVVDQTLVTGQNPASSRAAAEALISLPTVRSRDH